MKYFPNATNVEKLAIKTTKILKKYGIIPDNTLLFISSCSDEIENRLIKEFDKEWNVGFLSSGLAGFQYTSKTGMKAALSHVPDEGNMLVIYCSHIGKQEMGNLVMLKEEV